MRGPPGCPGKEEVTSSLETLIHAAAMTEICIATMVKADHSPLVPCSQDLPRVGGRVACSGQFAAGASGRLLSIQGENTAGPASSSFLCALTMEVYEMFGVPTASL